MDGLGLSDKPATPFKRVGQYDLYNQIGQGSFATVYRGTHRASGRVVAVKAIQRTKLNRKLQENLEAEISILQSTQHPNVMRLHEVQGTERHVYLILEYCPGGDLMQVIRDKGAQPEAQTREYLEQLANGLQHLRQRNLIHRDLKPQNLLLSAPAPHGVLKIGDFGFARFMQQQDLAETLRLPLYMAPEISASTSTTPRPTSGRSAPSRTSSSSPNRRTRRQPRAAPQKYRVQGPCCRRTCRRSAARCRRACSATDGALQL